MVDALCILFLDLFDDKDKFAYVEACQQGVGELRRYSSGMAEAMSWGKSHSPRAGGFRQQSASTGVTTLQHCGQDVALLRSEIPVVAQHLRNVVVSADNPEPRLARRCKAPVDGVLGQIRNGELGRNHNEKVRQISPFTRDVSWTAW
jgi:hypothetical protein